MRLHEIRHLIFIIFTVVTLASCNSKEPISISIYGPPAGQTVTADQRANFSKTFGDRFRAKFGKAKISTQDTDGKTLVITWTNVDKSFAKQMAANEAIVRDLREMGFKRLILTDGYRSNWDVDLKY